MDHLELWVDGNKLGSYSESTLNALAELSMVRDTMYLKGCAMAATTMVHIRVDEKVKTDATKTLAAMGMSVSDAVRLLLIRVAAEKALPFEVKVPNATTVKAMQEADRGVGKRFKSPEVLFKDLGI